VLTVSPWNPIEGDSLRLGIIGAALTYEDATELLALARPELSSLGVKTVTIDLTAATELSMVLVGALQVIAGRALLRGKAMEIIGAIGQIRRQLELEHLIETSA